MMLKNPWYKAYLIEFFLFKLEICSILILNFLISYSSVEKDLTVRILEKHSSAMTLMSDYNYDSFLLYCFVNLEFIWVTNKYINVYITTTSVRTLYLKYNLIQLQTNEIEKKNF